MAEQVMQMQRQLSGFRHRTHNVVDEVGSGPGKLRLISRTENGSLPRSAPQNLTFRTRPRFGQRQTKPLQATAISKHSEIGLWRYR